MKKITNIKFILIVLTSLCFSDEIIIDNDPRNYPNFYQVEREDNNESHFLSEMDRILNPLHPQTLKSFETSNTSNYIEFDFWIEDTSDNALLMGWQELYNLSINMTLVTPNGDEYLEDFLPPSIEIINEPNKKIIHFKETIPGSWKLKINCIGIEETEIVDFFAFYFNNSTVDVEVGFIEMSHEKGNDVIYNFKVTDNDNPILNCNLTAKVYNENMILLSEVNILDNGLYGDEISNDGIYTVNLNNFDVGSYQVKTYLEGTSQSGVYFKREYKGGFTIIPPKKIL